MVFKFPGDPSTVQKLHTAVWMCLFSVFFHSEIGEALYEEVNSCMLLWSQPTLYSASSYTGTHIIQYPPY